MDYINCAGKKLDLCHPQVMGILNVTPDSFSEVGRFVDKDQAIRHAQQMWQEGAAIIDIGGEPTNPNVHPIVSIQEELDRVMPVIEALRQELPILLSVDTSKPEVMREAIALGVHFINDVRALQDPRALAVVAQSQVGVCLMHMGYPEGKPAGITTNVLANDPVETIYDFLKQRTQACLAAGIDRDRIVVDPGIGHGNFGKNLSQNLQLLARLAEFKTLHAPILIGVSRKTFLGELLEIPVDQRLVASVTAAVLAVQQGAAIIRVHDVRPTVEALKIAAAIINSPLALQE